MTIVRELCISGGSHLLDTEVTVIAFHKALPGKEEALKQSLLALCVPTRAEKGCINYDFHESVDDPARLVIHENWTSKADLDAHLRSQHIESFRRRADELLAEPPQITLWKEIR
jgi:quinol monooxygenase YgiN